MKATLEFNLPEEREEHKDALMGPTYRAVLEDLRNALRSKVKYTEEVGSWQAAHDLFWKTVKEAGVELD